MTKKPGKRDTSTAGKKRTSDDQRKIQLPSAKKPSPMSHGKKKKSAAVQTPKPALRKLGSTGGVPSELKTKRMEAKKEESRGRRGIVEWDVSQTRLRRGEASGKKVESAMVVAGNGRGLRAIKKGGGSKKATLREE